MNAPDSIPVPAPAAAPLALMCSSIGLHEAVVLHDLLVAQALRERGARADMLFCDGVLPACEACTCTSTDRATFADTGPGPILCAPCIRFRQALCRKAGITPHVFSTWLDNGTGAASPDFSSMGVEALRRYEEDGLRLGEEAYAGTLRYFAVGDLEDEPRAEAVLRRYLAAARMTHRVIRRAFRDLKPSVTVFHHGIYVPQGVIGQVARQMGIRVVNWAVGYRRKTFIYSHHDTYHRTMIDEPVSAWRDKPLDAAQKETITRYLESRRDGLFDWIKIMHHPEQRHQVITRRLGLDSRPVILLLTNVTWDAQLYYRNNGFPSLLDWLDFTIRYFARRADCQLVIRVHPAELSGTMVSRQPVMAAMQKRFAAFPPNVIWIPPESEVSTYAVAELADCAVIFGTKTGVELTARGMPVIVAGEAWIRGKGLTLDVQSRDEYRAVLDRLPLGRRMPEAQREQALQYAYHYFFRRLIPLECLTTHREEERTVRRLRSSLERKWKRVRFPGLIESSFALPAACFRGQPLPRDPALDTVCRGILEGRDFVLNT